MTQPGDWRRVTRRRPCPICDKPDWCLYAGDDDLPDAAICARVESPKRCGEAGWLHVLRRDGPAWPPWRRSLRRAVHMATETPHKGNLAVETAAASRWCDEHPEAFERFARNLGLSTESLRRLGVGYSPQRLAWLFPMRNAAGDVVGIRLRLPSARKLSVKGGREGLFLPSNLQPSGRLFIAEGPSDTATLLDFGFEAVGRPSCTGGVKHLCELVRRLDVHDVVMVADQDEPGQRGANRLASTLVAYCPVVRVIAPPAGVKDARAWKRAGATAADVLSAIDAAEPRRLRVKIEQKGKNRCKATMTL